MADASDDLSGSAEAPDANRANALLLDLRFRTHYRTAATGLVIVVIVVIFWLLSQLVHALTQQLDKITGPAVAMVASMVLAVSVLSIAALRWTFQADEPKKEKGEPSLKLPDHTATVIGAVRDALEAVAKAITPKG